MLEFSIRNNFFFPTEHITGERFLVYIISKLGKDMTQ